MKRTIDRRISKS